METTTIPQPLIQPEGYGNFTPPPDSALHLISFPSPEPLHLLAAAPPKPRPRRKPDHIAAGATSTPPCTECGKRFSSWKALFGHMRCHPERQWRGINPPPRFRRAPLLLSAPHSDFTDEEYGVAESLIMLANGSRVADIEPIRSLPPVYKFECESCGRAFGSQQALGRHKASHRGDGGNKKRTWEEAVGCDHRCNVCSKVFSSGQALGGHMRRHLEKGEVHVGSCSLAKEGSGLDLNLPPPDDGSCCSVPPPSPGLDLKLGL